MVAVLTTLAKTAFTAPEIAPSAHWNGPRARAGDRIAWIRLDQILDDPANARQDLGDLEELAQSIKSCGVIETPVVTPVTVPDGHEPRYWIISGHRRVAGARLAGETFIQVIIRPAMDEVDRAIISLIANLHRKDLKPLETARGFANALAKMPSGGGRQAELARRLGVKKTRFCQMVGILRIPADLLAKVQTSEHPISEGVLFCISPQTDRLWLEELIGMAIGGARVSQIRRKIANLRKQEQQAGKCGLTRSSPLLKHRYRCAGGFSAYVEGRARDMPASRRVKVLEEALSMARDEAKVEMSQRPVNVPHLARVRHGKIVAEDLKNRSDDAKIACEAKSSDVGTFLGLYGEERSK